MAYYNNEKITFQQLVMEQIKIIQNICSKELKDGDKVLKNSLGEQVIEGEDTRHSFLQSVEVLGSMLSPYFGTSDIKDRFKTFCESYDLELVEVLEKEEFIEDLEKMFSKKPEDLKGNEKLGMQVNIWFLNEKLKFGREIFRNLVQIFKDNNFLSSESFGEGSSDSGNDAYDEDDGEIKE